MQNKCVVFYCFWEMECCGEPFSPGTRITWPVIKDPKLITLADIRADYMHDSHNADWQSLMILEGTVESIEVLYESYIPSSGHPRVMLPYENERVNTEIADGSEEEKGELKPSGYIVIIRDFTVRPAEEREITFR